MPVITHVSASLFSSTVSPSGRSLVVQPSACGAPPVLVNSKDSAAVPVVSVRAPISASTGADKAGGGAGGVGVAPPPPPPPPPQANSASDNAVADSDFSARDNAVAGGDFSASDDVTVDGDFRVSDDAVADRGFSARDDVTVDGDFSVRARIDGAGCLCVSSGRVRGDAARSVSVLGVRPGAGKNTGRAILAGVKPALK